MVSGTPIVPRYTAAPPTAEPLDYAELAIIDLHECATYQGRLRVAQQIKAAMSDIGFFYVVNHGYTKAQTERIFDLADIAFTQVSAEEKQIYAGRMKETGSHQGYKLRNYWHIDSGVNDQVEAYNINRDVYKKQHPLALRPFLRELEDFGKHNHFNVLHPLLRLLALGMELPEETFVNIHGYNSVSETFIRFMKYYPRSENEETKTRNVWLKGHTDFGSVTVLYSQPVAALQVLSPDGKWRWIRHMENALVINTGDAMEFLSGGFYKPTIHRVVQPPLDQRGWTRLGAFYFSLPDDSVKLVPFAGSPVLRRNGITRRCNDKDAPTMEEWRKGRTSAFGTSILTPGSKKDTQEEIIRGLVVRHYL